MKKFLIQLLSFFLLTQANFIVCGMTENPFGEPLVSVIATNIDTDQRLSRAEQRLNEAEVARNHNASIILNGLVLVNQAQMMQELARFKQNQKDRIAYKAAKAEAKKQAVYGGIGPGIITGVGIFSSMFIVPTIFKTQNPTLTSALSSSVFSVAALSANCRTTGEFYENLNQHTAVTREDKLRIIKKYHDRKSLTNTIASAAAFAGAFTLVSTAQKDYHPAVVFCGIFPVALTGMAAINGMGYMIGNLLAKWRPNNSRQ